ncbi:60S acidic ribosomal protein P2 [Eurytemora carolleeae]|uniref:60S acidic ribosomal protein P2 n=1 Tax=Eurytemora carolleeae TaxID=1294199 RepID=UPI000C76213B|nr:60S acidic ribosomal protein P2 [Eurytemora carolleeae]|eukprot:XP_023328576.1 60S acidic ribosomal protein P2-like [Eurytemora affinis]
MRYVAAALLLALAEDKITAENIEKILSSVGVESDKEKLALVVKQLAGKSIDELAAAGRSKLAAMPSGGAAAPAAAGDAPAAAGGAAPAGKKEEKKVEEEEEEDDDMGFGLFD